MIYRDYESPILFFLFDNYSEYYSLLAYENNTPKINLIEQYPNELKGKALVHGLKGNVYFDNIPKSKKLFRDAFLIPKEDINYFKLCINEKDYYGIYDLDKEVYDKIK